MNVTRFAAALSLASGVLGLVNPAASIAGPNNGVKCPSGYSGSYNSQTGVFKCEKTKTEKAAAICPDLPFNVYKVRAGTDKCATFDVINLPVTGPIPTGLSSKLKNVKCLAMPGTSGWTLKTDVLPSGGGKSYKDECRRTVTEYAYPNQL